MKPETLIRRSAGLQLTHRLQSVLLVHDLKVKQASRNKGSMYIHRLPIEVII